MKTVKNKSVKRLKSKKIAGFSLILIGIGLAVVAAVLIARDHKPQIVAPADSHASQPAPAVKKPTSKTIAEYTVPPTDPKYISIPAINVEQSRIIKLGLLANNQIAAPSNIYDAGWYDGSARPGQNGAMFIYGHLDDDNVSGLFWNLKNLRPGDKVNITRGDNQKFVYEVDATKVYPVNNVDMSAVLSDYRPGTPGLNLMTCAGKLVGNSYQSRLVVFTSLVSS